MAQVIRKKLEPRVCPAPGCGKEYPPTRKWQKFCSDACRQAVNDAKKAEEAKK